MFPHDEEDQVEGESMSSIKNQDNKLAKIT